MMWR
jgi:addiction module HigA family antidote